MTSLNKKNIVVNSIKAKSIIGDNITGGSTTVAGFRGTESGSAVFPAGLVTQFPFTGTAVKGFTHAAGVFTCLVDGRYFIDWNTRAMALQVADTGRVAFVIQVNTLDAVVYEYQFEVLATSVAFRGLDFNTYLNLNAGDTINFDVANSTTQSLDMTLTNINCNRVSDQIL